MTFLPKQLMTPIMPLDGFVTRPSLSAGFRFVFLLKSTRRIPLTERKKKQNGFERRRSSKTGISPFIR